MSNPPQSGSSAYQPQGQDPYGQQPYSLPSAQSYGQQQGYADPYAQQPPQDPYAANPYGSAPGPVAPYGMGAQQPFIRRPNVNFMQAMKAFFQNYANFKGRANRGEYWWAQLGINLIFVVLSILAVLGMAAGSGSDGSPGPLTWVFLVLIFVFYLAIIIPTLSVTVRRLHDVGMTGWLTLVNFLASVGSIILLIFTVQDSKPEGMRYDEPGMKQPSSGGAENTQPMA